MDQTFFCDLLVHIFFNVKEYLLLILVSPFSGIVHQILGFLKIRQNRGIKFSKSGKSSLRVFSSSLRFKEIDRRYSSNPGTSLHSTIKGEKAEELNLNFVIDRN